MPGDEVTLGPFTKGLHNSSGLGEYIDDAELFDLVNLEVDIDGSLANRPPITTANPSGISGRFKIIGVFISRNGSSYLVLSYGSGFGTTGLYSLTSNTMSVTRSVKSNVAVQYNDRIWIIPASDGTAGSGGYWDSAATPAWTTVATMPRGDDACIYKDHMYITAGLLAITNLSQLSWSMLFFPEYWKADGSNTPLAQANAVNDADVLQVETGNGQRLVSCLVMNQDLVLFKEHSTFRYVTSGGPLNYQISKISSTIGTPNLRCAANFDNNNIYLLHDNSVYELYNYTFTKLSAPIAMTQVADSDIYADSTWGLTVFRNRIFVRYNSNFYVYNLLTGRWCRWVTTRKFTHVYVVPNSTGTDQAYAASTGSNNVGSLFNLYDDRVTNIANESFTCSIVTKTYDFDIMWAYKVLFWWGMTIATSGPTTAYIQLPSTGVNYTWKGLQDAYHTWGNATTSSVRWGTPATTPLQFTTDPIPFEQGPYSRKFLKFNKKIRFRQLFFTVSTPATFNATPGADASVRIYDLALFIHKKETVVRRTT